MILLDTNVISELMKPSPSAAVMAWIDQQPASSLFVSTITLAEIEYGLYCLPEGKRRQALKTAFHQAVMEAFEGRIFPFDESAAPLYGAIMGTRKAAGRPMTVPDGQIAAIAKAKEFMVATRNVKDFEACGIEVINPWELEEL